MAGFWSNPVLFDPSLSEGDPAWVKHRPSLADFGPTSPEFGRSLVASTPNLVNIRRSRPEFGGTRPWLGTSRVNLVPMSGRVRRRSTHVRHKLGRIRPELGDLDGCDPLSAEHRRASRELARASMIVDTLGIAGRSEDPEGVPTSTVFAGVAWKATQPRARVLGTVAHSPTFSHRKPLELPPPPFTRPTSMRQRSRAAHRQGAPRAAPGASLPAVVLGRRGTKLWSLELLPSARTHLRT